MNSLIPARRERPMNDSEQQRTQNESCLADDALPEIPPCGAAAPATWAPSVYSRGRVHVVMNEAISNFTAIEVEGGYVLIDTGPDVASARKALAAQQPQLPKGRPSTPAAKAAARTTKRLAAQGPAWCTHRSLVGQRHLTTTARKTLWRVSRGVPQ